MPWGTTGPKALTKFAKKHDRDRLASPPDVFYPVSPIQTRLIFDPDISVPLRASLSKRANSCSAYGAYTDSYVFGLTLAGNSILAASANWR
jgi:hypothetical protein